MRFSSQHTSTDRQSKIKELRHQMRYASSPLERNTARAELDFWLRQS